MQIWASSAAQLEIQHKRTPQRSSHLKSGCVINVKTVLEDGLSTPHEKKLQTRPATFNLPPSTFDLRPSTFNLRPSTFDLRPSTFDLRPSTFDLRPSTFDLRPSTFDLRLFLTWPAQQNAGAVEQTCRGRILRPHQNLPNTDVGKVVPKHRSTKALQHTNTDRHQRRLNHEQRIPATAWIPQILMRIMSTTGLPPSMEWYSRRILSGIQKLILRNESVRNEQDVKNL